MPSKRLTTFDRLRRCLGGSFVDPAERAAQAARLIDYLQDLGFAIATSDDVLNAIDADSSEEELSAHRCLEGIAVVHASDGWWLLFPHGNVEPAVRGPSHQPSLASGGQAC